VTSDLTSDMTGIRTKNLFGHELMILFH